jgi:hypothetical protein
MKSSLHSLTPFLPSLLSHLWLPYQENPSILSQPKSKLCYDRRSVVQYVLESSTHLRLRPDFYCCQTVAGLLMWGALSLSLTRERGLLFTIAAGPRQHNYFSVWVPRDSCDHILHSQLPESPSLEGQVPVFISPRKRVIQLYPQALDSLFVAS